MNDCRGLIRWERRAIETSGKELQLVGECRGSENEEMLEIRECLAESWKELDRLQNRLKELEMKANGNDLVLGVLEKEAERVDRERYLKRLTVI